MAALAPAPTPRLLLAGLTQKQQAVAAVIAGRISLAEAAARFRAAGGSLAAIDTEVLCQTVIGWVHLALSDRPERAEAVTARLEWELQNTRYRFGGLSVPA
jgi:hypothetical protein